MIRWKEEVRHWKSLQGHSQNVIDLFQNLPASATVVEDFALFLYHVGEQSLPGAFILLAQRLKSADWQAALRDTQTSFLLEALLLRFVYGRPLELKRDEVLRDGVLFLLDILVEGGSSAAFRMRDDFVTPIAGQ